MKLFYTLIVVLLFSISATETRAITPTHLRCEYFNNPAGIDAAQPKLSWQVESGERVQKQTAYRILLASTEAKLANGDGDLWDTGKIDSGRTLFIEYAGKPLESRQQCFWNVRVWDANGASSKRSEPASWSMELLSDADWSAQYISYRDKEPIHTDVNSLYLPAARQYRKGFAAKKQIKRATIYSTALGIYELHLNGQRVGDASFAPGWTDYRQRAYYNTYDATELVQVDENAIGAWVADGWYSGYVGFGLLTEMGTEKTGRATYGKTPSVMAQLEIEYADGSREPGTFIFDLGQNFAGTIRLKVKGPTGHRVKIRYGEMLHPDGRLMTENLRKARATDFYTCKGDPNGEVYEPRFTFHGFQFVEVSDFPGEATLDTVTRLVLHSDTPMTSTFACSDRMVNRLFKNVVWTQRSNFLDLPTDCPQRDERMGWTGDARAYVATAAYNAVIGAFYTKWLREMVESQRPSGAFPGYAPFPFQHGWDFGTERADAGVICPWTIWQFYGDTQVIENCWEPMTRFMQWRKKTSVNDLGITHGNAWGDWLAQGAETPLDYVDTVYYAISARMMAEMAAAIGRSDEAATYRSQFEATKAAFQTRYLRNDGSVNVNTQTAQALALFADLIPDSKRNATGRHLAKVLEDNWNHMATGFLGTHPLLPVLSASGQNDLATFLLQSREFPSWGYEIENGATTIWERWDSYTKEDAFGRHNAAMNSFSHYAFGAVCEWMFATLASIQSDGPGFERIIIRPNPPVPGTNARHRPIDWARALYDSIRGTIRSEWRIVDGDFKLNVSIPANTTARVYLPTNDSASITESGESLEANSHVEVLRSEDIVTVLAVASGDYMFSAKSGVQAATVALKTSKPKDNSINPEGIDLASAKKIASWDFTKPTDTAKWIERKSVEIPQRDGKAYVVATGDDSQMAARLDQPATGKLVIELRAMPTNGATSQCFWAHPGRGFNAQQQSKRTLRESEQVNAYLYTVNGEGPVKKLRFDPFVTYDKNSKLGEMMVESISVYQLN